MEAHEWTNQEGYRFKATPKGTMVLGYNGRWIQGATTPAECAEILRLAAENRELRADRESLQDLLYREGFVRCDIPACNCGSLHHVGGYAARHREFIEALDDAGYPLTNANGHLARRALQELIDHDKELKAGERRRQIELLEELDKAGEGCWDNSSTLDAKQMAIDSKLAELRAEEARSAGPGA